MKGCREAILYWFATNDTPETSTTWPHGQFLKVRHGIFLSRARLEDYLKIIGTDQKDDERRTGTVPSSATKDEIHSNLFPE